MPVTKKGTTLKQAEKAIEKHQQEVQQATEVQQAVDRMVDCKAILDGLKDIQDEFDGHKKTLAGLAASSEHNPEEPVIFHGTKGQVGFSKAPIKRIPESAKYKEMIEAIGLDNFLLCVDLSVSKFDKNLGIAEKNKIEELGGLVAVYGSRSCNSVKSND